MLKKSILMILFLSSIYSCNKQTESPNTIMMIGDGMGISQVSTSMYSSDNYTPLERSEYVGLSKTHALDDLVTDSAASGTALSAGVKTYNGVLGLDKDYNPAKSILEISRDKGYMTAIIVTSTIVHATPAAYFSKSKSRYEYDNIADELSKSGINFFVGGGERYFNDRVDNRNLMEEMKSYVFVNNLEEYKNTDSKNIGFFTAYDDPLEKYLGREPSLDEIVDITLKKLKSYNRPFFLLVESSQIDWAEHDNDPEYLLSEMLEFDRVIKSSFDFADKNSLNISMLVVSNESRFLKKAKGKIRFECDEVSKIKKTLSSLSKNKTTDKIKLKSTGYDESGDVVSEFIYEWSFKLKL